MKRTAFLAVLLVGATSITALAQDAKPYKDGPVSDVSYIRTKPGQFDNYMKWLAGPWKNLMDAQKKAGLVSDYAVYMTEPATPNDPDLILVVTMPNMAALDRTDEAFEAYLLEILSDFQVTVPELGTIKAEEPPIVIITTNRTREIHDALKRRCLYHWVDYPDAARELEIVGRKVPGANRRLSAEVVAFVQRLRQIELFKAPGVAETIDWAGALTELDKVALDPETVSDTIGVLLKYQDDIARIGQGEGRRILDEVKAELAAAE